MFFKDVIGQEEVKRRLLRSVDNDHVAHASCFVARRVSVNLLWLWLMPGIYIARIVRMGMLAVYVRLAGNIRL